MTVGQRIKMKREELGLSQGDLAKKLNMTRQAVSKAELHDNNITTDKVRKFASALGVTESFLMGWEKKEELVSAYVQAERDGEILNVIRQLNDANAKIVLNLAKSLLMQQ